jgi:hypothetical protein
MTMTNPTRINYCQRSYPPIPKEYCTSHRESPFDIFPVATTVLGIGVVVTLLALIYIQFLMN